MQKHFCEGIFIIIIFYSRRRKTKYKYLLIFYSWFTEYIALSLSKLNYTSAINYREPFYKVTINNRHTYIQLIFIS